MTINIYVSTSDGQIGLINNTSGEFTPVVNNFPSFTDIDNTADGQFFGITFSQLYSLNLNDQTVELIGGLPGSTFNSLEITPDDRLFSISGSRLYEIDPTTADTNLIGNVPFTSSGDLIFDRLSNRFFATGTNNSQTDDLFTFTLNADKDAIIETNFIGEIGVNNVFGLTIQENGLVGYSNVGEQVLIDSSTGNGTITQTINNLDGDRIFGALTESIATNSYINTDDGRLGIIDRTSGDFTPLANNLPIFSDIDSAPNTQVFGITFDQLFSIDFLNETANLIGNLPNDGFNSLEITPDDRLFSISGNSLYEIDADTAQTDLIGNVPFTSSGDLVFDPLSNRFFATGLNNNQTDDLYSITLNGEKNAIVQTDFIGEIGVSNVFGLTIQDNTLVGYSDVGEEILIDTFTGNGTIAQSINNLNGSTIRGAFSDSLNRSDNLLTTRINRFQNSTLQGTFLFADERESRGIRSNFPQFEEEGIAFNVSDEPVDGLIRINRFQNSNVPGTFLFADEGESRGIRSNFPEFIEEGIAFYAYGADANVGIDYYRFQNTQFPGTYIFVDEVERNNILSNPNLSQFVEEGIAFEVS